MENINQQLVLVIGAGPAGLYSANKLAEAGKKVILLNRDIKYGGLAEYGIFVTKNKMKEGLRKQFRKILASPNIDYYGNVTVGKDSKISLKDLEDIGFDAIVISAGAQGTKKVGIPGEEAKGVYHAKDLVYHYNHLPPFSEQLFPLGDKVAIIGVGNVMVDIAHWLTHLKQVPNVLAIARRGPNERAYSDKEIKNIAFNMDQVDIKQELERIRPILESIGQNVDTTFTDLVKEANEPYYDKPSPTKFTFKFLCSPKRVVANENNEVIGLEVENNELYLKEDGSVALKGLGTTQIINLTNVVFAIGDTVDGNLGLTVNKWGEFTKNETPYNNDPNANLYELFDTDNNTVMKGMFVIGWSRKASDGLVGIAKKDGETGTKYVLSYLDTLTVAEKTADQRIESLKNLFKERNLTVVSKEDITLLEDVESQEAKKRALEFYKFNHNDDMLQAIEHQKVRV
ncbi:MAG: FAD-dependent oxidoreductase [Candidatus Sericytochromatia bacterium]|nr:FAD-dependent oxidoreductase [Candidatus Sericytochromatia bacterium]